MHPTHSLAARGLRSYCVTFQIAALMATITKRTRAMIAAGPDDFVAGLGAPLSELSREMTLTASRLRGRFLPAETGGKTGAALVALDKAAANSAIDAKRPSI